MMRKLIFTLIFILSLTLSGCKFFETDYASFKDYHLDKYTYALHQSDNRYVLYVYNSVDEGSDTVKDDILHFFDDFTDLEFYLLDHNESTGSDANLPLYDGEPVVYIISNNKIYEEYKGSEAISDFIVTYSEIEFDYDLFEAQHVTTYEEVLNYDNDSYILYYYFNNCPYCIAAKPEFLPWAFTKSAEDILFMEGSTVQHADQLPTELIILNSGTPILVLMSNGKFMDEFYSSTDPVLEYINTVGSDMIIPEVSRFEYTDFEEYQASSVLDSLSITEDLHFEYYYSETCKYCIMVKEKLLLFADVAPYDVYFFDTHVVGGSIPIDGFIGTPTLYLVKDGHVVEEYIGLYEIPKVINEYMNRTEDFSVDE